MENIKTGIRKRAGFSRCYEKSSTTQNYDSKYYEDEPSSYSDDCKSEKMKEIDDYAASGEMEDRKTENPKVPLHSQFYTLISPSQRLFFSILSISLLLRFAAPYVDAAQSSDSEKDKGTLASLAEGTQDLAALIGLFCTDTVEMHAVDFGRGSLSAALSLCSLLGILGYVRALAKLAMGIEACANAAISTVSVRPILGLNNKLDRVPKEEVFKVLYIESEETEDSITYKTTKAVDHTTDSFAFASRAFDTPTAMVLRRGFRLFDLSWAYTRKYSRQLYHGRGESRFCVASGFILTSIFAAAIAAALTSFPILFVAQPGFRWTRFISSYGLFGTLFVSSSAWALVYCKEQIFGLVINGMPLKRKSAYPHSNSFKISSTQAFLILKPADNASRSYYMLYNVRAVEFQCRRALSALSALCAAGIVLGYLCQYIELKTSSKSKAAYWLAFQGSLAILRIIFWICAGQAGKSTKKLNTSEVSRCSASGMIGNGKEERTHFALLQMAVLSLDPGSLRRYLPETTPEFSIPKSLYKRLSNEGILCVLSATLNTMKSGELPAEWTLERLNQESTLIWTTRRGILFDWLEMLCIDEAAYDDLPLPVMSLQKARETFPLSTHGHEPVRPLHKFRLTYGKKLGYGFDLILVSIVVPGTSETATDDWASKSRKLLLLPCRIARIGRYKHAKTILQPAKYKVLGNPYYYEFIEPVHGSAASAIRQGSLDWTPMKSIWGKEGEWDHSHTSGESRAVVTAVIEALEFIKKSFEERAEYERAHSTTSSPSSPGEINTTQIGGTPEDDGVKLSEVRVI